ncbi:MAG: Fic family protein [Pseudomonadota bacterium]
MVPAVLFALFFEPQSLNPGVWGWPQIESDLFLTWYPPRATREALANAFCHRDYTIAGGAVAVAIYDDHLEITNPGELQFGITPEKLTQPHESKPWNPIIANVFYRAGIIERWGMGTLNIIDWCFENGNPSPTWDDQSGSVFVSFFPAVLPDSSKPESRIIDKAAPEVTPEVTPEVRLLKEITGEMNRQALQKALGLKDDEHFRKSYLQPALAAGFIEMTIPEKPRSSRQKYRLTEKGQKELKKMIKLNNG